jgi:hypothetical protein
VRTRAFFLWLLLAVVAGALAWVFLSRAFLAWAWQQAEPVLPEGVTVESVTGRLAGPIKVHGLHVDTATARIRVAELEADWRP